MQVRSQGQEEPLEKEMAAHSSILACLGNTLDRGAWPAIVHGGHKELDTTERLNNNNGNTQELKTRKEGGEHKKIFEKPTHKFFSQIQ